MPSFKNHPLLAICLVALSLILGVQGQDCSATKLCATGCCSQYGFCGTDDAHCGAGCQSTCDFKLGCDKNNPCKDGTCCSKFGFCGLGPDYCSNDNCVANCDSKSYCNPGYGAEWSQIDECPLRVCCSKWGYCGLTEEFCGDKKVQRPSCAAGSNPVRRVVGYYEGWAARRNCMTFRPSDIEAGVYTHLNFAFASIDPATFHVVPADSGDVSLYSELTSLKTLDPNLKVYIAIGGWDFTEPWKATRTTFSDLAASEANQRVFFASLISFMSTYNFDGVDIDWEYPAADDRSGRPEDFANFPNFIRNLKSALDTSSGGRNGLSVTLPVAYWYLQHFDIINLQDNVDFFNVMSYDLHGTWDEGTNYTQPWLNSHTNLTEITDYLDLLWRNNIEPGKVTLGLAFYSRTFGLVDPSCTSAGGSCYFHSGGKPGRCSNNVGTLMGAEVKEILDSNPNIQPLLDRDAAVKIFAYNGDWITFDDLDTWRLKIQFAQSECLGGVMVWAVSQDYPGSFYSSQLQEATGYKSPGITFDAGNQLEVTDIDSRVNRPQCRWSNCGEDCGSGYYPIFRSDTDRNSDTEYMMDSTNCKDGSHHTLCCPASGPYAKCGWYDFWNGECGGQCPSGYTEVGSSKTACHTSKPQAACCTTRDVDQFGQDHGEITATALYSNCQWEGISYQPGCHYLEGSTCPDGSASLVASRMGSGGEWCSTDSRILYCCGEQTDAKEWTGCYWQQKNPDSSGYCNPTCPQSEVRVAMEWYPPSCKSGGWAYCCTPVYKTDAVSDDDIVSLFDEAMSVYMEDPVCRTDSDLKLARDNVFAANATDLDSLVKRQPNQLMPHQNAQALVQRELWRAVGAVYGPPVAKAIINKAVSYFVEAGPPFNNMGPNTFFNLEQSQKPGDMQTTVENAACDLKKTADASTATQDFTAQLACDYIWQLDSAYSGDGDDGGDESDGLPNKRRRDRHGRRGDSRFPAVKDTTYDEVPEPDENGNWPEVAADGSVYPYHEIYHELYGRSTGSARGYTVDPQKNDRRAPVVRFSVRSSPYYNGNDGDELILRNGDTSRYLIKSTGCGPGDYTLDANAAKSDAPGKWVSEHILELQAFPRFLETALSGKFKTPGSTEDVTKSDVTWVYPNIINAAFAGWPPSGTGSPATQSMSGLGSIDHADTMVVCESALNAIKSRIFRFFRPVSVSVWASCCQGPTVAQAEKAFSHLQRVFGVFNYYEDPNVQAKHRRAYENVKAVLASYEATDSRFTNGELQAAWKQYCTKQARYMGLFAQAWAVGVLGQLSATWIAEKSRASQARDVLQEYYAAQTLDAIEDFQDLALVHFNIDSSIFT